MLETLSRETLTVPQDGAVFVVTDAAHRVVVRRTHAAQPALRRAPRDPMDPRDPMASRASMAPMAPMAPMASVAWSTEGGPRFEPMPMRQLPGELPRQVPTTSALRITRRGRLVLVATVVALLFLAFSVGRVISNAAPAAGAQPATHTVVVAPGDTAWSIAREAMPKLDGRDAVDRLLALNHSDGRLQVGQTLLVPGS